jgi:fermentation-respiration switch protein FrsA (DUF1100 family)
MNIEWIILVCILAVGFIIFLTSAICYFMVFYSKDRKPRAEDDYDLPPGKEYEPFYPEMVEWTKRSRATPHKKVEITTFDGLTLRGRYYELTPDAPIEIMMHGYQGNLERDLSGGIFRAMNIGHSVLLYDHRGSGMSDGNTMTFGINESRDCRRWIDYVLKNINPNAKIILSGVSMGAATAMITSGYEDLPDNVVGIVADCGYTSAEDIIKKVVKEMKLPPNLLYPFIKLGARLFGGFDLDEFSPIEQVKKSKVATIFVHGDTDGYVPMEMSERNYEACSAKHKKLVIIKGADHGLAYPVGRQEYLDILSEFFAPVIK